MKFAAAAVTVRAVVVAEGSHRRCHQNRGRERDRELAVEERIGAAVLHEASAVVPAAVQPQLAPPKLLPSPSLKKLTGAAGGYRRSTWFCFESRNRVRGCRRPYLKPLSSWVLVVTSYSALRCFLLPSGQMHRSLIMFFALCRYVFYSCRSSFGNHMVGVKAVFVVVKVNGTADAAAAECEPKEKEFMSRS
ncbi:uncharacterized protein DS421_19g651000 [Arachis hypogaea]|uniref:Uncharacterized protein n=1 Tax=Arachis hypogaea TaxID=3818 RepID=A0A6B9V6D3_ARAHY|nr:uncharacterized protein DS421_19g651000 [Arachis hypogaea]